MPLKAELEAQVKALKQKVDDLQSTKSVMDVEMDHLVQTVNKLGSDNRMKDESLREANTELRNLNEKLHQAEVNRAKAERQTSVLEDENSELEKKLDNLATVAFAREAEAEGLTQAVATMTDRLISASQPDEVTFKLSSKNDSE